MATPDPTKSRRPHAAHDLGRATWTDVADARTDGQAGVLLVPVGSCEQHGPQLPLDTDTTIALAVAHRVAATRTGVWVAPAVAYGSSGEHQSFPGTLSIGTAALTTVLVELARSALPDASHPPAGSGRPPHPDPAGGFDRVVFVNGHGGNVDAVRAAVEVLVGEGRPVSWWSPRLAGDAHAGHTETSLMLAVDPSVVGDERPVGNVERLDRLLPRLRAGGVASVSPDGVLGDATGASEEVGAALVEELVADLADHLGADHPG